MKKNIPNLTRLLSLAVMLALIMPAKTQAQDGANFIGTWILNKSESYIPEGGMAGMASTLVVSQEPNFLTITSTGEDGTQSVMKYSLNGNESVNGDSKSVATWSSSGMTLNIATTRTSDKGERKSTETWSRINPYTLSISFMSQDGERIATLVYEKK